MEREIDLSLMVNRYRTEEETALLKVYVKTNVDPKILEYRKRIQNTESSIIPSIIGDVQDGYSPILLVCGRQRKGKTRFGVTLANIFSVFLYYSHFDYKNGFFLYPRKLLQAITDEGYQILCLDEAGSFGSGINKREWYSELAELFDYVLQTQGNLNNIYIFILPFASDLTTDIRKYVDYLFSAKRKGLFRGYKIYKREDQLVKNLKDFKQVWIEMLHFRKSDLPESIWRPIEKRVNEVKSETRKEKIKKMMSKGDWLHG